MKLRFLSCLAIGLLLNIKKITSLPMMNAQLVNILLETNCSAQTEKLCGLFTLTNPPLIGGTLILVNLMSDGKITKNQKIVLRPEYVRDSSYEETVYYDFPMKKYLSIPNFTYYHVLQKSIYKQLMGIKDPTAKAQNLEEVGSSSSFSKKVNRIQSLDGDDNSGENMSFQDKCFINLNAILKEYNARGKFFLYNVEPTKELPYHGGKSWHSGLHGPKEMNIMERDFSYWHKPNFRFVPATAEVCLDAIDAWSEIDKQMIEFLRFAESKKYSTHYTVINGFLTNAESDKEIITHLMKQVIYQNDLAIMFLIPNRPASQQIEITSPVCERSCEGSVWPFKNEMVNCCDLRKTELFEHYKMLPKNPLTEFKPISVFKNDQKVSLVPDKFIGVFDIGVNYFCNNGKIVKMEETEFFVLEKVSARDFCHFPIYDELLLNGLNVRGIIVHFSNEQSISQEPRIEKLESELESLANFSNEQSEELELKHESLPNTWKFLTGKDIFKNRPNYWFIKLGILEKVEKYRGYLYSPLLNFSPENPTLLYNGQYKCSVEDNVTFMKIYKRENVIKNFITLADLEDSTMKRKYLAYMWVTNYLQPIPYISNNDIMFDGHHESYFSCPALATWKTIYDNYRKPVEKLTRDILSKANGEKFVYTFQHEPLIFQNGNVFHLYKENRESEEFLVHRYLVNVIFTANEQIAMVTINDVFLLDGQGQTPFQNDNSFLIDFCRNKCPKPYMNYFRREHVQINYCCSLTKEMKDKLKSVLSAREGTQST